MCTQSLSHVQLYVTHGLQPSGCSPHGILQARILKGVAIPFSRQSSQPRNRTWVSCIAGVFLLSEPPEKPIHDSPQLQIIYSPEKERGLETRALPWEAPHNGEKTAVDVLFCFCHQVNFSEMVAWHHHLNGHESEQTLGDRGQGSLVCCSSWGRRVRHNLATEQQGHSYL